MAINSYSIQKELFTRGRVFDEGNTYPVYFRISLNGARKRFRMPNIRVYVRDWDRASGQVMRTDDMHQRKNIAINQLYTQIDTFIFESNLHLLRVGFEDIEAKFFKSPQQSDFIAFGFKYIEKTYTNPVTQKVSLSRWRVFATYCNNSFPCDRLTPALFVGFRDYCQEHFTWGNSNLQAHFKLIRTILNEAIKMELLPEKDYLRGVKIKVEAKEDKVFLTAKEFGVLFSYYQTHKRSLKANQKHTLAAFLFGCLCYGIRPNDIELFSEANICDGVLSLKESKTQKARTLRIPGPALQLLEENTFKRKYFNNLPSNQTQNKILKVIASDTHINKPISRKTERKTFATCFLEFSQNEYYTKVAIGHAASGITEKHYIAVENAQDKVQELVCEYAEWIIRGGRP